MSQKERRQNRIKAILEEAAKAMEVEGVKYFIGAVDRIPEDRDGGQVYTQADVSGDDFCHLLDAALPTNQDIINLGIYVGRVIQARTSKKP